MLSSETKILALAIERIPSFAHDLTGVDLSNRGEANRASYSQSPILNLYMLKRGR